MKTFKQFISHKETEVKKKPLDYFINSIESD